MRPPAIRRASSPVGSKEKLNTTTTSNAKNSMELMASLLRHSRRRSFIRVANKTLGTRASGRRTKGWGTKGPRVASAAVDVTVGVTFIAPPRDRASQPGFRFRRNESTQIHPQPEPEAAPDASPQKLSFRHRAYGSEAAPCRARKRHRRWKTARPVTAASDHAAKPALEKFVAASLASIAQRDDSRRDPARRA